jgi:hypothetical protein
MQALSEESVPEEQLGFRRVLAGIYTHTAAHIVAAPMAHYMAKNMSRFRYSHDSFFMPTFGVLKMLNEENLIMTFRKVGGRQVTFHQGMNYLYRPKEMEDSAMYQYYSEMQFTSLADAKKTGTQSFEFTKEHPFHGYDAVIYRIQTGKQDCVPVFSWKFIGSTKEFERSMMEPVSETDRQYRKKEEYAQRFMIVFLPFRTDADLKEQGSYQRAFQTAYKDGRFSEDMIAIANNIQSISNSIESGIPENCLSSRTTLPEADEFDVEGEEDEMGYEDLLSSIGDLFAAPEGERLQADATCLHPDFSGKELQGPQFIPEETEDGDGELCSVIERGAVDHSNASAGAQDNPWSERFRTKTGELNSLLIRQENVLVQEEAAAAGENPVVTANACGSWQSVVKWGQRAGLDAEQQVAFEILAATYVLTFYDEAEHNMADGTIAEFMENKARLMQLARRNPARKEPLRMFVTGPAGAGKCKKQCVICNNLSQNDFRN